MPHEELGPPALELEEAEGELVAAATLKGTESTLARERVPAEPFPEEAKAPANLVKSSALGCCRFAFVNLLSLPGLPGLRARLFF